MANIAFDIPLMRLLRKFSDDNEQYHYQHDRRESSENAIQLLISTVAVIQDELNLGVHARWGHKKTLLIGAIPLVIGWILIGVAESISVLYVARVLYGIAHGLNYAVLPMYLAEIASDKVRGSITIMLTMMAKLGILCSYAVGSYTNFRTMAWIGMAPPIIFVACFIFMPDSPYHLIGKQRGNEAIKSLKRLRGHNYIEAEYEIMLTAVRKSE